MKVVVVGLRGIPDVQGGVETHAQHLYPILSRLGCEVTVLGRRAYTSRSRYRGVNVIPLWAPQRPGWEALVHTCYGVLWAARVKPDVLHVHAVGPGLLVPLARLLGLRVVFTHHGQDYRREKWGRLARLALRLGERAALRYADVVIAVSRGIGDAVHEEIGSRCVVIPNGVAEHPRTDDRRVLDELGLVPARYILTVGRLVAEKRQDDLMRAFAALRAAGGPWEQWKLVIVGAADRHRGYVGRLTRQAAQNDGVVLAGFRTGEELASLYSHAGVFCLPSSHEGLPIALLEALSYGLPVVASDIRAHLEVGLVDSCYFRLGDAESLAMALARQAAAATDAGAAAQRRALVREHHDWEQIALGTLAVYGAVGQEADQK